MNQDQLSPGRGKAFTFTEISEGVEIFKAHSCGNGHFIPDIPREGLEVCFELKKFHDTLDIQIHDVNLLQWLQAIPSLHDGFVAHATPWSINMARLLPYYVELKEKFNQDRFQGLTFKTLQLFILHFLRDRSIFAIFGLEDLYQAGTLTEVHFCDFDSWDWDYSMSKDLDCLDEIVNELDERGELDDLDEPDEQDEEELDEQDEEEPDEQDEEDPCYPATLADESIRSELCALIRKGDLEAVKRVLDVNPGIVDAEALCIAVKTHKTDILCQLLEHSVQVDGNVLYSPLCDAAKYGNKDAVQLLLSRGAPTEGSFGFEPTALTLAASEGHFEIVRYLVDEQGAEVNGWAYAHPLFDAIKNGHTRIVDYLVASGADMFKNCDPSPPFLKSHSSFLDPFPHSFWRRETFYTGNFERLAADCCARTRYLLLSRAAADGDLGLVKLLLSFGVDVNSTDKDSPLYCATKNRRPEIVRFLLEHATDVRPAGVSELLCCAAESYDLDTICLLLGCGPRLHLTLLNKLISVAGPSGDQYRVEAARNTHDGVFIHLPKDESFAEWDSGHSFSIDDMFRDLDSSKKRREIIDKLAAKIVSALEKSSTVWRPRAFTFFKSTVQRLPDGEVTDLEDCPVFAAIQAQERRTMLRRLFAKMTSERKRLLHAGASQGASTGLVSFAHKAGTETSRAIWKRGTRVIRTINEGFLPSSLPEIVSILQVANAMRSAVPASDLVCSKKEFVNDIPKWAALLNEEDQLLFLEIAQHLWCLPLRIEIAPTPDTFSIWEDLERLVNNLMRASGLFDHDFEHPSSRDRLQPLRQRYLPGMSPSHTYEGDPPLIEWRPPPAADLQETQHTIMPEPPDPEGGHSSIVRDITYLMTGAIFGTILLFLCLHRYGYSTLSLPILASYDRQGSDLDRIMNRNCVILALYIEPTFCVGPGSWETTDHLPVPTSLSPDKPESVPQGRAEDHLAAFESRSEGAYTTIKPPDVLDTAMEDAPPGCSPELQTQAPPSSSVTSASPSATNTAAPPDLTRTAVPKDGYIQCEWESCTSRFDPGPSQKGNYKRHWDEKHIKNVMYECKWKGCDRKRPRKGNVEVHEKTCKNRANGLKADFGQRRRRLKGQPTGSNTRRTP